MSDWRAIETKPRDHFPVLTWSVGAGMAVAFQDVTWAWWPCPADSPLKHDPTLWMPLPARPAREGETTP